jgi:uncharacterized repeat protein (TIGR02543 family)
MAVAWLSGLVVHAQMELPRDTPRDPLRVENGLPISIQATATVQASPPRITLNWPSKGIDSSIYIHRKAKGATSWGTAIATLASNATSYVDSTVAVETGYEYMVRQGTTTSSPQGYVYAGINMPEVHSRGKVVLLVAANQVAGLGTTLDTLIRDLVGDGWQVLRHDIAAGATVPQVKALIKADYDADPTNVKAVYILGHVPVPYSGNIYPDGHTDHRGAWPADGFYGDMDGTWTDTTVNTTTATRTENRNIPGDGKFDQSYFSGTNALELYVGRVDLYNMPAFALTETQLLAQYINKAHDFRVGTTSVTSRALVKNNFDIAGVYFDQNGWRLAPLVGTANIEAKAFTTLRTDDHLWAYGAGGGSYTSAGGIASTADFAANTYKAMFHMLFGSYFGDWDVQDNFLRAPLCNPTYGLTNAWAGFPNWFFHHMGLGEPIGYALLPSTTSGIYAYSGNSSMNSIHIALMGDPTLRLKYVKPVTNATAVVQGASVNLSWTASAEPDGVAGYRVYRAANLAGPYTQLTSSRQTGLSFSDSSPLTGNNFYQVRAIKLETSSSGSYYNTSSGAIASANFQPPSTYSVTFQVDGTAGASLTGALVQTITHGGSCTPVTANAPAWHHLKNWTGTGGFASTANPVTVTNVTKTMTITANFEIDKYTVRFQADTGGSIGGGATQLVPHGGSTAPVTPMPVTGYHFVDWTQGGSFYSTAVPLTIDNVTEDLTFQAHFALNEYVVTFIADPTTGGTVNGETVFTETVLHGSPSSPVTAAAAPDHLFTGWDGEGDFGMTNPVQLASVTGPHTVTATFLDTTGLERLATGSAFTVDENELVAAIDQFTKKPKVFAIYYDPVKDLLRMKPKKAGAKVLSKVGPKVPATTVGCEWAKKIRLYKAKDFLGERKLGVDAIAWLGEHPIDMLPMPLRVKTKEPVVGIIEERIRTVLLTPPELGKIGISEGEAGAPVLTILGQWFGTRAPKVWLEYADPAGGAALKVLKLKPLKPDGQYLNAKGKPVFMDRYSGESKVVVALPTLPPKGVAAWTDITILVIENGTGMDADAIPWE